MKVEIRPQRIHDAKRFFEILSNPHFKYFPAKPNTVEEDKNFLRLNRDKRKTNREFNFSIICDGKHDGKNDAGYRNCPALGNYLLRCSPADVMFGKENLW